MKKQKMYAIYDSEGNVHLYETKLEASLEMICDVFQFIDECDADWDDFRDEMIKFLKKPSLESFHELIHSKEWETEVWYGYLAEYYQGSLHVHEVAIKSQLNKTIKEARTIAKEFIKFREEFEAEWG
tara:strand:+ start:1747 stop:2127 length:381 start_codon:yes stop_codon:yes gene_type:complete